VALCAISRVTGSGVGHVTSVVVVPLIAIAELCSWYSVLTTSNLGHVIEESIWGLSAGLLVMSLLWIWPRVSRSMRPLLAAWCAAGVAYVAFMFLVDVPMYWSRWMADEASGRGYLSLSQGLLDVSGRWVVSHRSGLAERDRLDVAGLQRGGLFSIALNHAPAPAPAAHPDARTPAANLAPGAAWRWPGRRPDSQ
jgi:hypothetical protein